MRQPPPQAERICKAAFSSKGAAAPRGSASAGPSEGRGPRGAGPGARAGRLGGGAGSGRGALWVQAPGAVCTQSWGRPDSNCVLSRGSLYREGIK